MTATARPSGQLPGLTVTQPEDRRSAALRVLLALVSSMGMPYTVLMPAMASTVFHGGPHTLGFLMTASGAGAVVGALYLASRQSVLGLGRVMTMATLTFGTALVAFADRTAMPVFLPG